MENACGNGARTKTSSESENKKDLSKIKHHLKGRTSKLKAKFLKFKDNIQNDADNDGDSLRSSSTSSVNCLSAHETTAQCTPLVKLFHHENHRVKSNDRRMKQEVNKYFKDINPSKQRDPLQNIRDIQRNSRNRTNSEQSSISMNSFKVGIEFSKSTRSTIDLPNAEPSTGEIVNLEPKPRRRHRRRSSKNEKQTEINLQDLYDSTKLNAETFLILDLLHLTKEEREEFLINVAKKKQILVENPETNEFVINPEIEKIKVIKTGCTEKRFDEKFPIILDTVNKYFINNRNKVKQFPCISEESKKDSQEYKNVFEDQVNAVVLEGIPDDQKKQFTLSRASSKKHIKNYFTKEDFVEELELYARKCEEANLGIIIEGEIRINARNNDQAFIKNVYGERDAMFSSQLLRKCTLQGDIVRAFIRILPNNNNNKENKVNETESTQLPLESPSISCAKDIDEETPEIIPEKSAKGFVIKIVEKIHNRRCVGTFMSYRLNSQYITFIPRDTKLPNIRIYQENWPKSFLSGKMNNIGENLYVAEITGHFDEICIGKILYPIGKCGELESENKAILLQNNLNMDPYEEKFNEMFIDPLIISEEEIAKREDIRSECIFTIDPLTAKDLDDALSCKVLPDGNLEIGVHISDVSYFLPEESELDKIIKTRTTSVYMVNEVFHMLPKPLCFKCSLLPGEDKYAFSVFWIMTPEAEVLHTKYVRTILNSCTQLAYEHAQKIIDNPDKEFNIDDFPNIHNGFTPQDIVERVKCLHSIAKILRKRRFDAGSLKINRPKLYFDLHPNTGEPIGYKVAELKTANFMIEEFMLLANQYVAKYIYDKFPSISILRNHDPPLKNLLKSLKERLNQMGLELDITSSKSIYESFQKLTKNSDNPNTMDVCLSQLFSKPMIRAKYFCSEFKDNFYHYALAVPIYTHFTSPIRRYPDILVHRVLSAALGYTAQPMRSPKELQQIANVCNEKKYNAKLAGEDSANLYFLHYIKSKKAVVFRAGILEMFQHSMDVILIETGHVLKIHYPKEEKDHAKIIVSGKKPNYTAQLILDTTSMAEPIELKIFSEIEVVVSAEQNKLKGKLALPSKLHNSNMESVEDSLKIKAKSRTKCRSKRKRDLLRGQKYKMKNNKIMPEEEIGRYRYPTLLEWVEMVANCNKFENHKNGEISVNDTFKFIKIPYYTASTNIVYVTSDLNNQNAVGSSEDTNKMRNEDISQSGPHIKNSTRINSRDAVEESGEILSANDTFESIKIPHYTASTNIVYVTSDLNNQTAAGSSEDTNIQNRDEKTKKSFNILNFKWHEFFSK